MAFKFSELREYFLKMFVKVGKVCIKRALNWDFQLNRSYGTFLHCILHLNCIYIA
jgi:hypothetical protein